MSLLTTLPKFISAAAAVDANEDFTILWILLSGILVFFMQAGFTLVESGMTRAKNAGNIAMKNFMDISVGTLSFWALSWKM
jgi:Amt family ammonium transporter